MGKDDIRKLVKDKLKNKKIVLFGAGPIAEAFYESMFDKLNIVRCVSNVNREWGPRRFLGKLDVSRYAKEDIMPDEYMIVCGPLAFEQIDVQLISDGFKIFDDYIDSRLVPAIVNDKKIALFRGSCILRDIYNVVSCQDKFAAIYDSLFVTDNYTIHKYQKKIVYYCTLVCDLYVFTHRILRQDKVHIIDRSELPPDCIYLSVSNISFGGFWPQTKSELVEFNPYFMTTYNVHRNTEYYHLTYRDSDENINRLIDEGKDWEEIYSILSADDFYSEKEINRCLKIGLKSIAIAEQNADITVLDFIKENYKDMLLFQDNMHMHKNVLWEYIRRFYERLGITDEDFEEKKRLAQDYVHHGGAMPIYPCIIKKLGLTWIKPDDKYEIMTFYGTVDMDFKEYVKCYVEYAKAVNDIREMWKV